MPTLAIPTTPPAPAAAAGPTNAPAADGGAFGATLRQTQASPGAPAAACTASHDAAPPDPAPEPDADPKDAIGNDRHAGKPADTKADDDPAATPDALPLLSAIAPLLPAGVRQAPAADGKPLPLPATADASIAGPASALRTVVPTLPAVASPLPAVAPTATGAAAATGAPTAEPTDSGDDRATAVFAPATRALADDADKTSMPPHAPTGDFSLQLNQLVAMHTGTPTNPAATPPPVQLAMQATPDQPAPFSAETAQQVVWLAGQGIQKAEIRLNPRELGPIHVEINAHQDRIDVSFAVQHPQTVHALQQTLPHLGDMLAQQGLNLGHASVGQQAPRQPQAPFAQTAASGRIRGDGGDADPTPDWRPLRIATPGRVDDFA